MNRARLDPNAELDASLRRIRGALASNRLQYADMVSQIVAAANAEAVERVTAKLAKHEQRRLERRRRREGRREPRPHDGSEVPRGIVSAVVAIVCLVLAVTHPALWWMVFVALGIGSSAAAAFGRAARAGRRTATEVPEAEDRGEREQATTARPAAEAEVKPAAAPEPFEPPDPRVTRIQALCDKLLAELESGPPVVREVVTEPQATIGGLRQACIEIARRERELREVLGTQEESGLIAERDALAARLSKEQDQIVHDRLGQALRALEQKLEHRAELATAASRLEAENTRILYTLENLHMQLLRARSTDIGAPELGGKLRDSLRELGSQIDAVAEALEWASAPAGQPVSMEVDPSATTEAQRAERLDAARRAEQARQAQRR